MEHEPVIEDVDVVFRASLRKTYFKQVLSFTVATLVWELVTLYLGNPNSDWFFFFLLIPVFAAAALLGYVREKILSQFYKQFAANNGYTYAKAEPGFAGEGALFATGHSQSYDNIVRGTFKGHPMVLFNFNYTLGSGKNKRTYYYTVFEVDYDRRLPKMFLRVDKHRFYAVKPDFDNGRRLALEGDFDDYFDLFVEEKFEIEALQIFTPDIMHRLMTWQKFNLEFVNDKIYIYTKGRVSKKADLEAMYQLAKYLIEKLSPVLKRMESSVVAMQAAVK